MTDKALNFGQKMEELRKKRAKETAQISKLTTLPISKPKRLVEIIPTQRKVNQYGAVPNKEVGKKTTRVVKVATAKAMSGLDYTLDEIAISLGVSVTTARRYVNKVTDEEMDEFSHKVRRLVLVQEEKVAGKALGEMGRKIDRASFKDVTNAYKILRELRRPAIAIQQNNFKLDKDQLGRILDD